MMDIYFFRYSTAGSADITNDGNIEFQQHQHRRQCHDHQ